jgi:hypothetical protein
VRRLLRPICWFRGHYEVGTFKPEEVFGLYVYSRLWCRRCGRTLASNPTTEDDLRRWNEYLAAQPDSTGARE